MANNTPDRFDHKHEGAGDPFPEPTVGKRPGQVTKSRVGLRSAALAAHMLGADHLPVLSIQLTMNGYQLRKVTHSWLHDVHEGHHAGDLHRPASDVTISLTPGRN
jgi:hypothetical protein